MKRVLFFFPVNPIEKNAGNRTRALNLLKYFSERGIMVDYIAERHWGTFTPENIAMLKQSGLVQDVRMLERKPVKKNAVKYFFNYKIPNKLFLRKLKLREGSIPNRLTLQLRREFDQILTERHYDYILISYAYWADLIFDNPLTHNSVTIIDTHDLLSSLHQRDEGFDKSTALSDELRRLALFDQVWAISPDEMYFFSQFLEGSVKHIPVVVDTPPVVSPLPEKEYDLIYVATDNNSNLLSADWFFKKVYPLLPEYIRICVIGTIGSHVPAGLKNVTVIPFVESLHTYYFRSKIAICPMLAGTGVKVKVVEALSHGLPVVCTERGMDGLPDKSNNGCLLVENEQQFADGIQELLHNNAFYEEQSRMAKDTFRQHFSEEQVYRKLDTALNINSGH
ncbi:MAG TPA: glycosyltransferase [Chitinophaga sp.]|uniref:glycosyltransferase n=1 Tax=Chitinophaga sp. TaxID=1869181 RepID=UPI002C1109B6|nr:glycosyltransferase [Chitinophaga sp.]HVI43718.1 glycosyltransferase [Chitinophaga sp.]